MCEEAGATVRVTRPIYALHDKTTLCGRPSATGAVVFREYLFIFSRWNISVEQRVSARPRERFSGPASPQPQATRRWRRRPNNYDDNMITACDMNPLFVPDENIHFVRFVRVDGVKFYSAPVTLKGQSVVPQVRHDDTTLRRFSYRGNTFANVMSK